MTTLYLKYKGSRNYLQGGDIYNAIDDLLSARFSGHLACLVFKRFARNQIELQFEKPDDSSRLVGHGTWQILPADVVEFWMQETTQHVTDSYPFQEECITQPAEVEGTMIRGRRENAYSLIENIIALTKCLNYALTPDVDGKWLFGQLNLEKALPTEWDEIVVRRGVDVGNRFSRNQIEIDGEGFGEIRFIGGAP
jgi:hypothetical protein